MKLFNLREGEKPEDSKFPRRFYTEAINEKILDEAKIQEVLRKYYQSRGWDETGRPTEEKLKELGIE
jgi:aldehyde:ferredoxin oxidoreductase